MSVHYGDGGISVADYAGDEIHLTMSYTPGVFWLRGPIGGVFEISPEDAAAIAAYLRGEEPPTPEVVDGEFYRDRVGNIWQCHGNRIHLVEVDGGEVSGATERVDMVAERWGPLTHVRRAGWVKVTDG